MDVKIIRRETRTPSLVTRKTRERCPVCKKPIQLENEDGSRVTKCRGVFTSPEGNQTVKCPFCRNNIPINCL